MIEREAEGLFRLDLWLARLWYGQKVKQLSASASPKPSFMYKEGETSSPEVCHEGIILPQHLCSYEREIEVGK